ncbi:FadR/GntR family transcriptional regulator [uncultured Cohaesibacter sp.]|nr:FadR/GntR family transcriptional regulator [uncultured Cohaesibacter sp.]
MDIANQIRSGILVAGDKLPTEKHLSNQYSVSRTVVREAISRLKSDGLVVSRQGSGVFVSTNEMRNSFKIDNSDMSRSDVLALFELRQNIEVSGARLAAARHTSKDIKAIKQAQEAIILAKPWSEDEVRADLDFHYAIAFATQNSYYADFMAFLGSVLYENVKAARIESGDPLIKKVTVEEHERILQALLRRDPEAAGSAMMSHLQGAIARMAHE